MYLIGYKVNNGLFSPCPVGKITCKFGLQCIFAGLKSGQVHHGDACSSELYVLVLEIFYTGHRVQILANQRA